MRTRFTLYCLDKKVGKGKWRFQQHENGMNVIDPTGELVCWFAHDAANQRFDTPSFWRSVKDIVFTTDKGVAIHFEPDSTDVRIVREYLDDAILVGGIESLKQQRNWSVAGLLFGLVLTVVSIGVILFLDVGMNVTGGRGNWFARPLMYGAIFGIACMAGGAYGLFRSRRLFRRWKEEVAEVEPEEIS